jgi:hypothetical protein
MRRIILAAASVLALAVPALAQGGYTPPNEQTDCTEWTRKLETGLEVIAPTPVHRVEAARAALQKAKSEQQAGHYYSCAAAADSGLKTLDAG